MASERDIQDIINTLIAEGVGEGEEGMRLIAETILNRAQQRGISPAEVVRQRAQYTGYSAPGPAAVRAQSDPNAISAARAAWALAQGPDDPTGGANHYFNPNIVTPSWASQMTPTGEFGNHAFYTDREPEPRRVAPPVPTRRPDSLNGLHPFDASTNTPRPNADGSVSTEVTRTVQLPTGEWVNVPSLWWGQGSTVRDFGSMGDDQLADFASRYEKSTGNAFPRYASIPEAERAAIARSIEGGGTTGPITYPGNLVERAFAQLPKSSRSLGDEIALSPIQGGRQRAPMFDAAYDERTGQMRLTREPIDSQGIAVGRSSEPAPTPAVQSAHLAAMRANDPVLQAALNAKYPAQLPPLPAPAQPRPQVSGAMSYAGQDRATLPSPPVNVAAYSTLGRGSSVPEEYRYNTGLIGGPRINPSAPDRLAEGSPGMGVPGMSGISPQQVAQIGLDVNGNSAPLPYQRPAGLGGAVEVAKVAPIPFMRPDFPQVATALDVVPMPPLPIPRPKVAPIPFDRPNFGMGGPGFANLFGVKLPSIPRQMQTVAGRTSAFEPAMRQVMTGSPNLRTLTSAVAAQRGPGMSAQQAYDRANSAAVERAIAGASNSDAAQRLNERLGNI